MNEVISNLKSVTKNLEADQLLGIVLEQFGSKIALASSFSAEDQVITHMLSQLTSAPKIFTLDTGRLPQQTYDLMETTRDKYHINIEILFPDTKRTEDMTTTHGPNLFYKSIENRKLCCQLRKVDPLQKKLSTLKAWICGLRKEQSLTRTTVERIEWDSTNDLVKVNPIADWDTCRIWEFIRKNNVPYNSLHDEGYPSIGCAPCTRAIKPGENIRAGRWWWEKPEHKECGLHLKPAKE